MKRLAVLAVALVACSAEPSSVTTSPDLVSSDCTLPVLKAPPGMSDESAELGFVHIPGGEFSSAPEAQEPYYDKPLKRWVPGGPPALSADGFTLASVESDGT